MNQSPNIDVDSFGPSLPRERSVERFSAAERARMEQASSAQKWSRGGLICAEGERAEFVYFIESGVIHISRWLENGQRQILALRMAGDIFGLPDDGGLYGNSAEAICPARTLRLPWQRLRQMMREDPGIQTAILAKILHNFHYAQARIMCLGHQNAYQRVAGYLLDFMRVPEYFDGHSSVLDLPINRSELADYLGTVRQSAVRAFARLESLGLIRRIGSHGIALLDIHGLELLHAGPRRCAPHDGRGHEPRAQGA
jgi:CRP-like cAMP-binding protein